MAQADHHSQDDLQQHAHAVQDTHLTEKRRESRIATDNARWKQCDSLGSVCFVFIVVVEHSRGHRDAESKLCMSEQNLG